MHDKRPDISISLPDDFHVHLRQGPTMAAYAVRSAEQFGRILVMPNVVPPITGPVPLADYRRALDVALSGRSCMPLMTFKLIPGMGAEAVRACAEAGAVAGKYYPAGSTTNAADGVVQPRDVREELAAMEERGLILSIHAEDPSAPVLERETAFLPVLDGIVRSYPRLKIVMEHLSTRAAVDAVLAWPKTVAATITAHHLAFTIDDMLGEKLSPGFFCKPVLKTADDRTALRKAAMSGSPKFFFGSDSAPHTPSAKAAGAAGSYSAPVAMALLAQAFEEESSLDRLEGFCARAGAAFYGIAAPQGTLGLYRESWEVPREMDGVEPLAAGRRLRWQARRVEA